jgi:hypothetical protein
MSQPRRPAARRFIGECIDLGFGACAAAVEETGIHYRKGREEFYHRLAEHRRRKMCQRAEITDFTAASSKKLELTERNELESDLLRLPLELRMQIYEYIYTPAATIHIADQISRANTFRLQAHMVESSLHDPSCHIRESSCRCFVRRVGFTLPLTCRQLYSETIHYMYTTNTFRFLDNRLSLSLPNTIPVKHLQCITSLNLTFDVDQLVQSIQLRSLLQKKQLPTYLARSSTRHRNAYIEFWHFLSTTLTKLQSLVVTFYRMGSHDDDKVLEQRICDWFLAPLFQRAEGERQRLWSPELKLFEVRLGTFWFLHDDPEDSSFIDAYKNREAPFLLRRECECGHDFRYCILNHVPD